jgi:hypothetical protein
MAKKKERFGEKLGKNIDAGLIQVKRAGHRAKQFASKNKAALIAGGVGVAGLGAGAAALGHQAGKKSAQSET